MKYVKMYIYISGWFTWVKCSSVISHSDQFYMTYDNFMIWKYLHKHWWKGILPITSIGWVSTCQ